MKKAIYAFSADPITKGHIDIILRASKFFDQLIVAIGINQEKEYLFSVKDRIELVKKALINVNNVKIVSFKGLLVDYAYENNIPVIIKGVRGTNDFIYERNLHSSGESQNLGIETFIIFANPKLTHISSSGVKVMQNEQALIQDFVPIHVKQALEEKISNQFIIGITGEIGSGKSHASRIIVEFANKKKIPIHNIELDEITHKIYNDLKEPIYKKIRKEIVTEFGKSVSNIDGSINRKKLGEIVFNNNFKLKRLNEIMKIPLLVRFRREIYGKEGIILFNAALLAESEMTTLCNNNVLLITCNDKSQKRRLKDRGLNSDQIKRRLESQYRQEEKKKIIESKIIKDNHGSLWIFDNSDDSELERLEDFLEDIILKMNLKNYLF